MIFLKIEMENFISHRESQLVFDRGINMIVGPNGAGKSSILNAIRFALFGKERAADPVMHGASKCTVSLSFQIASDIYNVTRSFGRRQSEREAILYKNGSQIATSQDAVTKDVQKIIGMDQAVFEGSVFIRQGEIDTIVTDQPRKRKDFFGQILGIERLSKAAVLVQSANQKIKNKSLDLQGKTAQLEYIREEHANTKRSIKQMTTEKKELENELAPLKSNLEVLRTKLSELQREVEEIRGKQNTLDIIKSDLDKNRQEVERLKESSSGFEAVSKQLSIIENDPLYARRDQVSRLPDIDRRLGEERYRLEEMESAVKRLTEMKSELASSQSSYETWNSGNAKLNSLKTELDEPQRNEKDWIRLEQKRSDLDSMLKKLEIERNNRRPAILELFGLTEITREMLDEKRHKAQIDLDNLKDEIAQKKGEIGAINSKIKEIKENIAALEGKANCPMCGSELTPDHLRELMVEFDKSIESLTAEIVKTHGVISQISSEKVSQEETLKKIENATIADYPELLSDIGKSIAERDELLSRLRTLETSHKRFEEIEREIRSTESQLEEHDQLAKRYLMLKSAIDESTKYNSEGKMEIQRKVLADLRAEREALLKEMRATSASEAIRKLEELVAMQIELKKKADLLRNSAGILEEKIRAISAIESRIKNLESDVEKSTGALADYEVLSKEAAGIETRVNRVEADVNALNRRELELENGLSDLALKIAGLEEFETAIKVNQKALALLDELRKAYSVDGIQRFLRKRASDFITNGARQVLSSFSLDFDDLEVSEDFDITILRNGPIDLEALSGGERISLAIALRMSISRFLDEEQKMNCFLMDEPTTYLDQERRANLRNLLHYAISDGSEPPQIIMITHHTELTSAGDTVFEVSKKDAMSVVTS